MFVGVFLLVFALQLPNIAFDDENAKVRAVFNTEYDTLLESLLLQAQKEIVICMFQFNQDEKDAASFTNKIVELLKEKAKKGTKIRIILEGGEDFLGPGFSSEHKRVSDALRVRNIEIKFDPKNKTTHAKFVVIDCKYILVGSTNWTTHGLQRNNESNVLIESEEVAKRFLSYFDSLWNKSGQTILSYSDKTIQIFYGTVRSVDRKISKKGRPYTIIYLTNGTRVFIRGHHDVFPGNRVEIEGRITTFRGKEQIEAYKIQVVK